MTNKSIAEIIKEQIAAKKLSMRPKAYFTAGAALLGVGLAASILTTIFFIGVILFRLRVNAPFDYLRGPSGILPALENIPWIPVCIAIVGVIGGLAIMRKFDFSYKHAFAGIIGGFLIAVGIFGFIIDAAGLPERAEQLEPLRPFMHVKYQNDSWVAGTIMYIDEDGELLELSTPDDATYQIIIQSKTRIIPPTQLTTGEWVRVVGERDDNEFEADQIMHYQSPRNSPRIGPGPNPFVQPMR